MKKSILLIFILISTYTYSQNCTVNADIDQTVCSNASVSLTGSVTGLPTLPLVTNWSQVSGPSAIITNPSSLLTTVTGLISGNTYVFRFSSSCTDGSLVYDDMQVVVNNITTANAGPDFLPICPNAPSTERRLAANAVGTGETGAWTIVSGTGLTITTSSSPTSAFTMTSAPGNSVLRWTIRNNSTGCSTFDEVTIPKMGGTTISAGPDKTLAACYTPPFTSTVLAGSVAGNGIGGQIGTWTVISGPSVPTITNPNVNNSTVSNLIEGVYIFRWTVTGTCFNGSDDVQITVPGGIGAATTATATISGNPTLPFCDGRDNVVLVGNTPKVGETGVWTQTAPVQLATIGSPNSPITTVTGLNSAYDYNFRYTITNTVSGCNTVANRSITYATAPDINITTSKPLVAACGVTTASIAFTQSGTGTVQYSIISGPTTTTFPTIPSTYANTGNSPLVLTGLDNGGTYLVRLRKQSGTGSTCSTDYDEITLLMSKEPSLSSAGSNQLFACSVTEGSLNGNIPAPTTGSGRWSQVFGPNTATILNPLDPKTLISGLTNGNYIFRWLISNGDQCSTNQSDVIVGVTSITPTSAAAGSDREVCYNSPLTLDGNAPALNETGTWSVIPSTGLTFSNINSKNAVVNGMSPNTVYTFKWTIANSCGSSFDEVVITTNSILGPIACHAGSDQCLASGTTNLTLAGNDPSAGTGLWTKIIGPAATITNPNLNTTTVTGLTDGIYQFEWSITRNECTVTRDTVTITISKTTTTAAAGSDQIICGTSTILSGNDATTPTTSGIGTWSVASGSGGVVFGDVHSPNSTVSNLTSGVYTLRWTITNGDCSSNYDDVKLFVSIPPATALAGPDLFRCDVNSATMAANAPLAGQGTGYWSIVSGPGSPVITDIYSPTTTITGLTTGVYTFSWNIQNGPYCAVSSDNVVVEYVPNAYAGSNLNYCNAISANLFGNPSTTGTWTQIGISPNVATITATTPSTVTVSGLIPGTYTFRYTINTVDCSTFDEMNVVISGDPTIANAGADQDLCNATTWTMNANTPTVGTGSWFRFSGPNTPTISSASSPTATITNAVAGTYIYEWRITNGTCISVDRVHITISNIDASANAGLDQLQVCGSVAVLDATQPTNGVGEWSQISGPNTAVFSSLILRNASATGLIAGTYVFRWSVSNGFCTPVTDDVSITVFTNPTTPLAGADQNLCGAESTTLAGNTITLGTGTWTKESGPACNITSINSETSTVTGLLQGTYIFRWTSVLGSCTLFDEVTINVLASPSPANAGSDFNVCLYTPLNLNATPPVIGTGLWTQTAGSTVNILSPTSPTTSILGTTNGSYTFRWTVSNGICTANFDEVNVTIDNITTQPNAGPNQDHCNLTQFTLAGNTISSGTGLWSFISGPNTPVITDSELNNTTITSTIPGIYVFRWTATNGSCSQFDEVTINNFCTQAENDINQTPMNTPVSGQLLTNDEGVITVNSASIGGTNIPLGTATSVAGVDDAGNATTIAGSITINSNGTYTFVPAYGFIGTVNPITYIGGGINATTDNAILSIEVLPNIYPGNNLPIAQNDVASTEINTAVSSSVIPNDSDPEGNALTVISANFSGGAITIGTAKVISGVNTEGTNVSNAGSLVLNFNGTFTFTPASGFTGIINNITYTINDGYGGTDTAILSINVLPNNENTTFANDDANAKPQGITMTGNILTNDTDPEGNNQTVTSATANGTSITLGTATVIPSVGTLTITSTGDYTFVPLSTFIETLLVPYSKCDNGSPQSCDEATLYLTTLTLSIIAENDINQTPMNTTVSGKLLINDEGVINVNSASIGGTNIPLTTSTSVAGVDEAGNVVANAGAITINSDGTYTFVPSNRFIGTINPITYIGGGINSTTDDAILSIEVLPNVFPGNNSPIAQNDVASTEINTVVSSSVMPNDSDPDGNSLTVTNAVFSGGSITLGNATVISGVDTEGANISNAGSIVLNSNGTFTFTPLTGFTGIINDITYTISDGNGGTDTAILSINVLPNSGNTTFANDDANAKPQGVVMTGNILTNDFDPEGHTQTSVTAYVNGKTFSTIGQVVSISGVGNIRIYSNGAYTFTPNASYTGTLMINYTKCDNVTPLKACDDATLYLTSLPISVNAKDDINQTSMNMSCSADLKTNDDGVTGIVSASIGGTNIPLSTPTIVSGINDAGNAVANAGSITIESDGYYSFSGAPGFIGTINPITYIGKGIFSYIGTDDAILSIEVLPEVYPSNNPPVAQNDVTSTVVNIAISSSVMPNDSDPDGNALVVTNANIVGGSIITIGTTTIVSGINLASQTVSNAGSIVLNSNGTYTFTPTLGFIGSITDINYSISDGNGETDSALLKINVFPNNGNTTYANDDANAKPAGTTMTGNILTNDFDPEGNEQTVTNVFTPGTTIIIGVPTYITNVGTLTVTSTGAYTFVPLSSYILTLDLDYTICDNGTTQACDEATLYLTLLPSTIIAENDFNQTPLNTSVTGQLMTNDEGVTSIYSASIGGINIPLATSTTVSGINDAGTTVPYAGSIAINSNGTYTFTPTTGFTGTINPIRYVGSSASGFDDAILSIEVLPRKIGGNNPPIAQNDVNSTEVNVTITGSTVLNNDSDPDANTLTITAASIGGSPFTFGTAKQVAGLDLNGFAVSNAGMLTINAIGTYTYVPATGFTGVVNNVTYNISDGNGGTDAAILSINVLPNLGNSTFANDDANAKPMGVTMTGNVLTNDFDPEGNTQTLSSATVNGTAITISISNTLAGIGNLSLNSDGTYTFVPLPNYIGTFSVIYIKCDNGSPIACDEATLYLTSIPSTKSCIISNVNVTPRIIK